MPLFLARHASAGRRNHASSNDLDRELDALGYEQATALSDWFTSRKISVHAVISSRATRCVQTVSILAAAYGLPLETHPGLLEGAPTGDALDLLRSHADRTIVACSHGDIIPDVIRLLEMSGVVIDGERLWHKGSVWQIDSAQVDTATNGSEQMLVRAHAFDPMHI